jgi:hypothetical protein
MHFLIQEIEIKYSFIVFVFSSKIDNCQIRLKSYLNNRSVKAFRVCFIGTGLCKILVIVTATISESFQIIIRYKSNFNSKLFFVVCSCILSMFLFIYILLFSYTLSMFFFVYLYLVVNLFNKSDSC